MAYDKNPRRSKSAGFTLVEIAIVLVIIGLLLGGILKGQEMITQAKIKNLINDFNGVTVAITSYQDRYRVLPGDDPAADTRWASLGTIPKGNGNGKVDNRYNSTTANDESRIFWQHMRIAGFVPGVTTGALAQQQPLNAAGGMIGVESGQAGVQGMGFTSMIVCFANLPEKVAAAVDGQMDDGTPNTGQVRSILQSSANPNTPADGSTSPSAYIETGIGQYLLCKNY